MAFIPLLPMSLLLSSQEDSSFYVDEVPISKREKRTLLLENSEGAILDPPV